MSVLTRTSIVMIACVLCGCAGNPSHSPMDITADQAIQIAKDQAMTAGATVDTLSFKSITRDLAIPHINPVGIFAWAKVTPDEEQNDWIIFSFPMDPEVRGNETLYVINKKTGEIERTLYGD